MRPQKNTARFLLTRYCLSQGKGAKALEVANDAAGNNPHTLAASQNLGQAQMGANQAVNKEAKGLVLIRQAALQDARNIHIRLRLASAFGKTGKQEEARKKLERLLKENKSFPERA